MEGLYLFIFGVKVQSLSSNCSLSSSNPLFITLIDPFLYKKLWRSGLFTSPRGLISSLSSTLSWKDTFLLVLFLPLDACDLADLSTGPFYLYSPSSLISNSIFVGFSLLASSLSSFIFGMIFGLHVVTIDPLFILSLSFYHDLLNIFGFIMLFLAVFISSYLSCFFLSSNSSSISDLFSLALRYFSVSLLVLGLKGHSYLICFCFLSTKFFFDLLNVSAS